MEKFASSQALDLDLPTCHDRVAAIHRYWRSIRPADGALPGRQHFDPAAIPQLLPCIRLYDVHRDPCRFRYRLVGTELVRAVGRDLTGQWYGADAPGFETSKTFGDLVFVASGGGLSYHRGYPLIVCPHKDHLTSERILLPLARNGADVDMILGFSVLHAATGRRSA